MAMYNCDNCDAWVDDDYSPMQEHPWAKRFKKYKDHVVCDGCAIELEQEAYEVAMEDYYEQ